MARDITALEAKMKRLQQGCARLGTNQSFDEFFQIIHRAGWTTVIDEFFVLAAIESMQEQLQSLSNQLSRLMEGARQIGQ